MELGAAVRSDLADGAIDRANLLNLLAVKSSNSRRGTIATCAMLWNKNPISLNIISNRWFLANRQKLRQIDNAARLTGFCRLSLPALHFKGTVGKRHHVPDCYTSSPCD